MQQQPDWYEVLKLAPDSATERIEAAVERLSRQATALAVTAPERSQRLRDQVRAMKRDLLSGPENRARYDEARAAAGPVPPTGAPPAAGQPGQPGGVERMSSRIARFLRTGWTCASCGKEMLPSDKFCTKCGTPITPTRRDAPAAQSTRITCTHCGANLGANDVFCSRCGTRV